MVERRQQIGYENKVKLNLCVAKFGKRLYLCKWVEPTRLENLARMKEKTVDSPRGEVTQTDVLINSSYLMMLSMELMLRDAERRLAAERATIQREKKQNFTRFLDFYKKALYYADKLTDNIYEVDSENKWRNIPVWQDESNELARLILLYADRSISTENVNKVFKCLRELPGEGIVTEEMLDFYRLKK